MHDGTVDGDRTSSISCATPTPATPTAWTGSDDVRPLSGKGEKQAKRLGRFLAEGGFKPGAIITSPKTRARQTAEILGDALGVEIAIDERLAGGVDVVAIEAILFDAGEPERPVLVGHDPDLSELTSWIADAGSITLKKGALVRIDTVRADQPRVRGAALARAAGPARRTLTGSAHVQASSASSRRRRAGLSAAGGDQRDGHGHDADAHPLDRLKPVAEQQRARRDPKTGIR